MGETEKAGFFSVFLVPAAPPLQTSSPIRCAAGMISLKSQDLSLEDLTL